MRQGTSQQLNFCLVLQIGKHILQKPHYSEQLGPQKNKEEGFKKVNLTFIFKYVAPID